MVWASVHMDAKRHTIHMQDRGLVPTVNALAGVLRNEDRAAIRWGSVIPMGHEQDVRRYPTFIAGDSGLLIDRNNGGKKAAHLEFGGFTFWGELTASIGPGYTPFDWVRDLQAFITRYQHLLREGPGGGKPRFPPTVRCFVFEPVFDDAV